MAANPNPARITDALWRLWEACLAVIPGVRLGGIYAFKSGYHSSVNDNKANWPGNYSILLPSDLTGDFGKARAIDLTMSTVEMTKRTGHLKAAALHPDDDRLGCVREFYGTIDGRNVYGLSHGGPGQVWRPVTSDASHLWHIHISLFTLYCDDWPAEPGVYGLEGVLSVLSGETWNAWVLRKSSGLPGPIPIPPSPPAEEDDMIAHLWRDTARQHWYVTGPLQLKRAVSASEVEAIRYYAKGAGGTLPGFTLVDLVGAVGTDPAVIPGLDITNLTAGDGGPTGAVTVAAASVAEIAAASGKAAASEIRADPEQDGKDT